MTTLTIHGTHGGDVWLDFGADLICLTATDLANMRKEVTSFGTATRAGILFDESDVTELIKALSGPTLDDCAQCEGPGLVVVEGRVLCPGCVRSYGAAEDQGVAS